MIHNIEAEQQLLGAMLVDEGAAAFFKVSDFLRSEHFAEPLHARIYDLISRAAADGRRVSPVTMKLDLAGDEGLKELGGPSYLARLAGAAAASPTVKDYALAVVEAACRRALQEGAQEAMSMLSGGRDSQDVRSALVRALQALPEAGRESSSSLLAAVVDATQAALGEYQGTSSYLRTGIAALDGILKGVGPGNYCLIGGAPSMGKTSVAVEIACNLSESPETPGVFVSLEMSKAEVANRVISRHSRIPHSAVRDAANMPEADMRKWIESSQAVGKMFNLRIVPPHVRDMSSIYGAVRRAALDLPAGKVGFAMIDYAQLIEGAGKSLYEKMTAASKEIKQLARALDCPVFTLVQLSRDLGQRQDRRPHMYDIRDSGQFEQDADQAIFCHREIYWLEREGPRPDKMGKITDEARAVWAGDMERWKGRMELIVRKNRHGKIGTAEVGFHEATNRFWRLGEDAEGFA